MRAGISEKLSNCARQSHETVDREVALDILAGGAGGGNQKHIVLVACAVGIVVEVIHHHARPVLRKHNVQFEQKAADGAWYSALTRQGKKYVGSRVDKLDNRVG